MLSSKTNIDINICIVTSNHYSGHSKVLVTKQNSLQHEKRVQAIWSLAEYRSSIIINSIENKDSTNKTRS